MKKILLTLLIILLIAGAAAAGAWFTQKHYQEKLEMVQDSAMLYEDTIAALELKIAMQDPVQKKVMNTQAEAHRQMSLDDSTWRPSVALDMQPAKNGWMLHIITKDFEFTPEQIGTKHEEGKGYAHLFVNEEKVANVVSPWFHLQSLSAGTHTVRITLNSTDHKYLAVDEQQIMVEKTIEIPEV